MFKKLSVLSFAIAIAFLIGALTTYAESLFIINRYVKTVTAPSNTIAAATLASTNVSGYARAYIRVVNTDNANSIGVYDASIVSNAHLLATVAAGAEYVVSPALPQIDGAAYYVQANASNATVTLTVIEGWSMGPAILQQ